MGVMIAVAVSCSDKDEIDNGGNMAKGTTYSSVSITVKKNGTRALDDSQGDNAGTNAEQTMRTLKMLSTAGNASWAFADNAGADNTFWAEGNTKYNTAPWATKEGKHKMALVFNDNGVALGNAEATGTTVYEGEVTRLMSPNFTMTSAMFEKDIQPGITKLQAMNGTNEDDNVFAGIAVERVVSKGIVRKSADFNGDIKQGNTKVATVSDLTYAAVNGATKTYLFKDNAGERTLGEEDDNSYADFTSAIHEIAPVKESDAAYTAGLVRLGVDNVSKDISTAKEVNAAGAAVDAVTTRVFYFLENSGDISGTDMKDLGYYRFAYAKVYATYHPESVLTVDGDESNLVSKEGTGKYYVKNDDGTYSEAGKDDAGAVEGVLVWKLTSGSIEKGKTFYKGVEDGLLYASSKAAESSVTAPGQKYYTYTDGRCGYRTLWNRQTKDGSKPNVIVNADTRRNNAYMLDILEFAGLGFPWDESDPNDPNLPRPEEDEKNDLPDPTDPNVEPTETYMRVEAVVLPWNVVIREGIVLQ